MQIEKSFDGDRARIALSGRLDMATAMALEQELLKDAMNHRFFELDCAALEYISSAGIRALLALYRAVEPKAGAVRVINPGEQVREILEETGFDELLGL